MNENRRKPGWKVYFGWALLVLVEAVGLLTFVVWKLYH